MVTVDEATRTITLDAGEAVGALDRMAAAVPGLAVREEDLPFPIPEDDAFEVEDATGFLAAPELRAVGARLIEECDELRHLKRANVAYVWKRKGGKAKGKRTFGTCQKPSGLLAFCAGCDFVVAIAADHCRDEAFTRRDMDGLVHHELLHAWFEVDDKTGGMTWAVRGHDWEGFRAEVERYGLRTPDAERVAEAFRQAPLY